MASDKPSLQAFERHVARRNLEAASLSAIAILRAIDGKYGRLDGIDLGEPVPNLTAEDIAREFCTRFGAAFGALICDPNFQMTPSGFESVMSVHRWLDIIFAVGGFRTSDHLLPLIAADNCMAKRLANTRAWGLGPMERKLLKIRIDPRSLSLILWPSSTDGPNFCAATPHRNLRRENSLQRGADHVLSGGR